jgi:hypothetical protein
MADLQQIVQSRDFRNAQPEDQRSMLSGADPSGFGDLTREQQNELLGRVSSESDTEWFGGDMSDAYQRGLSQGAGEFAHMAANVAELVDGDSAAGQYLRGLSEELAEDATPPEDRTYAELGMQILGNLSVSLPVYAATMGAVGVGAKAAHLSAKAAQYLVPMLTFGTFGGLSAADQGFQDAMKAASKEAAFGALFGVMHNTSRAARASVLGGVAYQMTPEDLDPEERVAHGLTMAILAALHAKPVDMKGKVQAEVDAAIAGKMEGERVLDVATEKFGSEKAQTEVVADNNSVPEAANPTRRERELSIFIREGESRLSREQEAGGENVEKHQTTLNKLQQERAALMRSRGALPPDPVVVRIKHQIKALREKLQDPDVMENPDLYLKTEQQIRQKENDIKRYGVAKKKESLTEEESAAIAEIEGAAGVKAGDDAGKLEKVSPPTEEAGGTGDPPVEGGRGQPDERVPVGPQDAAEQRVSSKMDARREEYLDQQHGFLWADKETGNMDNNFSLWKRARSLLGMAEMQDRMVTKGHLELVADPLNPGHRILEFRGKGMGDILKPIFKKNRQYEDDFFEFGGAVQARELINQTIDMKTGKIRQSTPEEIANLKTREKVWDLDRIERGVKLENPEFRKVYEEMKEFNATTVRLGIEMDFFTAEQVGAWKRSEYGWSMARVQDIARTGRHRTQDKLMNAFGVRKLHGSLRQVRDEYGNFIRGAQDTARAILYNKFTRDAADQLLAAGGFLKKLKPDSKRIVAGRDQLRRAMKKEIKENKKLTEEEAAEHMDWLDNMPGSIERAAFFIGAGRPYGDNIISFLRNGKPEYYEVMDPVLYRAFEQLDPSSRVDLVGRWMATFKDFKQAAITLDPSFIFGNFIRDPAMALIMTRTGNKNITNSLRGLKHVWNDSPEFNQLMANGLGGSPIRDNIAMSRKRLRREAQRSEGILNPKGMVFGPGDLVRFMSDIGRAIELGPRVGEALRAREKGILGEGNKLRPASMIEAVFSGREVSTDFRVRGGGQSTGVHGDKINFGFTHGPQITKFMGDTVPFFNAMLAGSDRGYRAVFRDPHGKMASGLKMGLVGVSSVVLYGINRDMSEKYKHLLDEDGRQQVDFLNLPKWATTAYWHFYIPTTWDNDTGEITKFRHWHMPKLWEVGMIGSMGEEFAESMYKGDTFDKETLFDLMQIAAHNFNINTAHKGLPMPLPAGIDVMMEQAMNRILFTGSPIETMGMTDEQDWNRARSGQSRTMKAYGEVLKDAEFLGAARSPARAEALLRGVFGNWASMALQLTDLAMFPGGPALGWDDVPMVRRVYSEAGKYDKNTADFYLNMEEFTQSYNTMRHRAKQGDIEMAKEMMMDPDQQAMIAMAPGFDRANRKLQMMNREIDLIRRGVAMPTATPRERHHAINRVEAMRNGIMKKLNDMAEEFKKRFKERSKERSKEQERLKRAS